MSAPEGFDVRLPIGALFALLGVLLAAYGAAAPRTAALTVAGTARLDLWWGLVMLAFGLALLLAVRRAGRR